MLDYTKQAGYPSYSPPSCSTSRRKIRRFLPSELRERNELLQWLFWQVGGLGPMMGQAQHFFSYAPNSLPYAIERYHNETTRLLKVLDDRLADREYVCGNYSVADAESPSTGGRSSRTLYRRRLT